MFTGIIEDLGTIERLDQSADGAVVTIRTRLPLARIAIGESIAVNGCCLTVTKKTRGAFTMDVSPESLRRTVLGALKVGDRVNLERCLTLEKLLGGHMVSGHVDGVGRIVSITPEGDSRLYTFAAPPLVARYLVEKGSVAIDGISLTVFDICASGAKAAERSEHASLRAASKLLAGDAQPNLGAAAKFSVALIPHTLKMTTLGFKQPGDAVNLESDMLVKYVERIAAPYLHNGRAAKSPIAATARKLISGGRP
ncbi:MAG TPA: riboflavin synthase [Candidatus Binataceae bacterium]|nr:riboflavin synthase [Candidatus Binataceae bacterium]